MVEINRDRLLGDLRTLRSFGAVDSGVIRPTFSEIDMSARSWLREQMASAGLDARIDGVGNVFGVSSNTGPALIIGSHSDTQPEGGWLDGALGVIYAIEVCRALSEDPTTSHLAVDAVAWSDEEGTYHSCLGSRSFCDELAAVDELSANSEGESVREAIDRTGLGDSPRARLDSTRQFGYLEAHIEQGPRLEDSGDLIGVVTSIVGIRGCRVSFRGEQNHAGTTPMDRRADAGAALFSFAVELNTILDDLAGPTTVWTIGNASLSPGTESIIPGLAHLTLQIRDPDDNRLARMEDAVVALAREVTAAGPVDVDVDRGRDPIAATWMDESFRGHIAEAAERRVPGAWVHMPSGAGHDPMILSHHVPCAMLFIPSIGGISHDFAENSSDDDIAMGCQVLADSAASILQERRASA